MGHEFPCTPGRTSPLCSGDNLAVRLNAYLSGDLCSLSGIWDAADPALLSVPFLSLCVEVHTDHCRSASKPKAAQWTSDEQENAFIFSPSLLRWSIHWADWFQYSMVLASCASQIGNSGPQGSDPGCSLVPGDLVALSSHFPPCAPT